MWWSLSARCSTPARTGLRTLISRSRCSSLTSHLFCRTCSCRSWSSKICWSLTNSHRKCRGLRITTSATPALPCSIATFWPGEFGFSRVLHVLELFVQELLLLFQLLQQLLILFFQLHQMLVCLLLWGEALYYLLQMNTWKNIYMNRCKTLAHTYTQQVQQALSTALPV